MIRILSYNILVGGTTRLEQLAQMMRTANADVIGLVEATDPAAARELAAHLQMQLYLSGEATNNTDWQVGLLSRLPVVEVERYVSPVLTKRHLLRVRVEEPDGEQFTAFVVHLTADFYKGWRANRIRRREIRQLLHFMRSEGNTPHVLMGDFNSIALGERLRGSSLLRTILDLDRYCREHPGKSREVPDLNYVVPPKLRLLNPLLRAIPSNPILSWLLDSASPLYAPLSGVDLLRKAGYVDCFRRSNPTDPGYTWPASAPAGRVDFFFASSQLAPRLTACMVLHAGDQVQGADASDHLPVLAVFREPLETLDNRPIREAAALTHRL